MITQKQLKDVLHYNPETGEFAWIKTSSNRVKTGDIAGYTAPDKYKQIRLNNILYKAHRLAFLYMEGMFPINIVDHINHDPSDNRWVNLRHADRFINQRNMKLSKRNKSGISGVSFCKVKKKWRVRFYRDKKEVFLGYFLDKNKAIEVRNKARSDLDFSPTHGI